MIRYDVAHLKELVAHLDEADRADYRKWFNDAYDRNGAPASRFATNTAAVITLFACWVLGLAASIALAAVFHQDFCLIPIGLIVYFAWTQWQQTITPDTVD